MADPFSKYWPGCVKRARLYLDETIYPQGLSQLAGQVVSYER
jgi:hypothetical protein